MNSPIHEARLSPAEAAARIRKDPKAAFPGVKFTVRSEKFAGGTSVDVHYTDGPKLDAVEAIATKYGHRGFDSSDDSTYYVDGTHAVLTSEGIVAPTYSGFVFVTRRYTPGTLERFAPNVSHHNRISNIDLRRTITPCVHCGDLSDAPECESCVECLEWESRYKANLGAI